VWLVPQLLDMNVAVAGAAVAGYGCKVIARHGGRKQQQKWDKKNFNEYNDQTVCHHHTSLTQLES